MDQILKRHVQGKKVLILFIMTNLIYAFMLFISIPKVMGYANGMKLFDMMLTGYDVEYARTLLATLGRAGRNTYLYYQIPIDLIYPLFFGISYCLLLAYIFDKLKLIKRPIIYLCLIPILAGFFDYLENIGIVMMLNSYSDLSSLLVNTSNIFTILKSILTTVFFVVLLISMVVFLMKKSFKRT